jgi:hypothetical protein
LLARRDSAIVNECGAVSFAPSVPRPKPFATQRIRWRLSNRSVTAVAGSGIRFSTAALPYPNKSPVTRPTGPRDAPVCNGGKYDILHPGAEV